MLRLLNVSQLLRLTRRPVWPCFGAFGRLWNQIHKLLVQFENFFFFIHMTLTIKTAIELQWHSRIRRQTGQRPRENRLLGIPTAVAKSWAFFYAYTFADMNFNCLDKSRFKIFQFHICNADFWGMSDDEFCWFLESRPAVSQEIRCNSSTVLQCFWSFRVFFLLLLNFAPCQLHYEQNEQKMH